DMSENDDYVKKVYNKATNIKIVGVVTAKEGITSMILNPGVAYTSDLIDYIIDSSAETDIVKKQLKNDKVDVFSGSKFDEKTNNLDLDFEDLVEIDTKKLQSAFNINIDQKALQKQTENYMTEISNSVTTDIVPAKNSFIESLNTLANGMFNSITGEVSLSDIEEVVGTYLEGKEASNIIEKLETNYVVPKDVFKTTYSGLLKGLLQIYINSYYAIDPSLTTNPENPVAVVYPDMVSSVVSTYTSNTAIQATAETMAKAMTEAVMKKSILTKVGELTTNLTSSIASSFNVDEDKIASAFKMKITEDEITRIVNAMMNKTEKNAKTNLLSLGYQEKEEPTYISFYFNSFDGKENFKNFINSYNDKVEESKKINYTDTTGILMGSVKTIVNAVTYVLIAFVSISLVVSSIMIGIITYISVYERTKEIGILRAIGASKRNISSIFNAETFIIGLLSGLFGIGITYLLIPVINTILHSFTGNIPLNVVLNPSNAIILIILSIILTLIGGLIPAKAASRKDPVIALRTE
ncbi:MAG: ABC transporter permease, partial [Clostridia bacterium]